LQKEKTTLQQMPNLQTLPLWNPSYACRVNAGEMETLQHLTEESGISSSDLLRQSLLQLCDQPHQSTQQAA
jgi:hypothetical protein